MSLYWIEIDVYVLSCKKMSLYAQGLIWNISEHNIGTEELGHLEIIGAIVHQLTKNLTPEEIEASGFGPYYIDHTVGVWPQAAGGVPFNACEFQVKGDPVTDLFEDLAAEQKARSTYENILRMVKDPEVADPIRFLRKREIVHFQRFGEVLRDVQEHLNSRNFYAFNPAFDLLQGPSCNQVYSHRSSDISDNRSSQSQSAFSPASTCQNGCQGCMSTTQLKS